MHIHERPIKTSITPWVMDRIRDADRLGAIYGSWPDFADAEILTVALDRGNHMEVVTTGDWSCRVAPSLTVKLVAFDALAGEPGNRSHRMITLRFNGIGEFYMENFGYQNPVIGIGLSPDPQTGEPSRLRVEWGGTVMGYETEFTCESLEVLSVELPTPKVVER
jgi:hypothetical protein